ncbi:MAG: hypothetical protein ACHQZR_03765 [Candidatus Limnocylindrales bacterium]
MRIFFVTDVHGSDVCWRKFLNAGAFHKADVLIMGGDMAGKAMVPIVADGATWQVTLQEQRHDLATEEEVRAMERRISDRGYYPVRLSHEEVDAWAADPTLVDRRFKAEIIHGVERWMDMADAKLAPTAIRCIVSPANDDMFATADAGRRGRHRRVHTRARLTAPAESLRNLAVGHQRLVTANMRLLRGQMGHQAP